MPNKFIPPQTTTTTRTAATPIDGEILYDTDEKKLYYGDGTTLGGKPIGSSTVSDSEFRIQDNGDATKQIAFEASGITTGTTRTLTAPDASGTVALIDTTGVSDKDLFYYDAPSKLFKRIAIGTTDQVLIAKPSLDPPYQWATPTGGREVLTANRTYYVRTDGSDSNNGLTNTSGGAFLTWQKAIDVYAALDQSIYDVIIQGNTATHTITSTIVIKRAIGSGTLTLQGSTSTSSDCVLSATSISVMSGEDLDKVFIKNLKINILDPTSLYVAGGNFKNSKIDFTNVTVTGSNNAQGLTFASNCLIKANNLVFTGVFYVGIGVVKGSELTYADGGNFTTSATYSYVCLQAETSHIRWFDITMSGTVNVALSIYSSLIQKTGKTVTQTAVTDSLVKTF